MTQGTDQSRVANTPAGAGALWDWDQVVKVTCHTNCSYQWGCVLDAYVKDGRVVRVEQATPYPSRNDPDVPDWHPRGCQKGLAYAEHMYDATKLHYPLKRVGPRGSGQWQQIGWDQALSEIADTMLDVLVRDGSDCITYATGSGGSVSSEGVSFEALMRFLGVPMYVSAADVGDDHMGAAQVFGQPYVGCSVDNWWYADIILIWGGNPACTNINNYHFITEARYHGTKVITISPDYSPSALIADQWVPVNIGTDAALALSIAQVMIQEGLFKADFLREQTDLPLLVRTDTRRYLRERDLKRGGRDDIFYFWDTRSHKLTEAPRTSLLLESKVPALEGEFEVSTVGGKVKVKPVFSVLKEKLNSEYSPEQASSVTGVSPAVIRQLARDFGTAPGMVNISTFNWGKFYHGDLIERSIILDFVLGGHIGRKGATYSAFTQLVTDATISGVALRGATALRAAASGDPRAAQWQLQGYTQEMILMEYTKDVVTSGQVILSSWYCFTHNGLLELSQQHNSWDPTLKRPIAEYVKEAVTKGWQPITPKLGKHIKVLFHMGGSVFRRSRATKVIMESFLSHLELLVGVDVRMDATPLYADYILPASGWWEKWSFQGLRKIEFPFALLINKAVEPPGQAKSEWEIGCLLARKLEQRARERGLRSFVDHTGAERRLDDLYDRVTINGLYTDTDDEEVCRDMCANTANVQQIPWEELKRTGIVPATSIGLTSRSIGNACDIVLGEPVIPLTYHTVKKEPYPTLTRRMQFYIDHDLYLELGQELPTQLPDPQAGGNYPLRLTGGHARWSIHSNHVDDAMLLRLQRGGPTVYMSVEDARWRGIADGDAVEAYNDVGCFQALAIVSPAVRPGQAIVYHAWENFQFPGRNHFKSVMASPLNPVELAGGYFHIRPDFTCFHPGFSDRETRVEIRQVSGRDR